MIRSPLLALLLASSTALPAAADTLPVLLGTWGAPGSGAGQFVKPTGMGCAPDGSIWIADQALNRVQHFTGDGALLCSLGPALTTGDTLKKCSDVAVYADGTALICSTANDLLAEATPECAIRGTWRAGADNLEVDRAHSVILLHTLWKMNWVSFGHVLQRTSDIVDDYAAGEFMRFAVGPSGSVYVTERGTAPGIAMFVPEYGRVMRHITGSGNDALVDPSAVAVDAGESIYVGDTGTGTIHKFLPTGQSIYAFGSRGTGPGQFEWISDMVFDSFGHLYVLDGVNCRVTKYAVEAGTPAKRSSWGRLKLLYR